MRLPVLIWIFDMHLTVQISKVNCWLEMGEDKEIEVFTSLEMQVYTQCMARACFFCPALRDSEKKEGSTLQSPVT